MRLVIANRLFAGRLGRCRAFERTVADLKFDDVLSLSFQSTSDSQHGKRGFDIEVLSESAESDGHGDCSLDVRFSAGAGPELSSFAPVNASFWPKSFVGKWGGICSVGNGKI
jgi:hypothetical protein